MKQIIKEHVQTQHNIKQIYDFSYPCTTLHFYRDIFLTHVLHYTFIEIFLSALH